MRAALLAAEYTVDGVPGRLGSVADAALSRGETVPVRRVTRGLDALDVCIRLFLLLDAVPLDAAAAALPVELMARGGLLRHDDGAVRAAVDVRPYTEPGWWVVSDHGTGYDGRSHPLPADHVLGIGGASTTLATVTVRPRVERGLDLGTGCGVQALHLSQHCSQVVATDLSPRALALARLTAQLCGVSLDLREGSLFEPVAGERFDLVVSNPPFVVSPSGGHTYRDSGMPADSLCRALVMRAPEHLAPGGWCQLLANWLLVEGEDWRERVAGWVAPTGCDAWVVQREVQDPAEYAAMWLRDAGLDDGDGTHGSPGARGGYRAAYDEWLSYFDRLGVRGVGFGWITLRASGATDPVLRLEELRRSPLPLGSDVEAWFARQDWLAGTSDAALVSSVLVVAHDVELHQVLDAGTSGWQPRPARLHQAAGFGREAGIDPVGLAVLSAMDGRRPLSAALDAAAAVTGASADELRTAAPGVVRGLVEDGYLLPVR